jgi:multidrug efflux pump subunit AcrA (membrane-fusion protein)
MPAIVVNAKKAVTDANKRLAALQEDRAADAGQLEEAEAEERAVIARRAGLGPIQAAQAQASAARSQLEATDEAISELLGELSDLERTLDREELLSAMASASADATAAEETIRAALSEIAATIREPLLRALEAHAHLSSSRGRFRAAGLELVPGAINEYSPVLLWDAGSSGRPDRAAVETELRRRGYSLRAVLLELQPPVGDDLTQAAWAALGAALVHPQRVHLGQKGAVEFQRFKPRSPNP